MNRGVSGGSIKAWPAIESLLMRWSVEYAYRVPIPRQSAILE